MSCSPHTRPEVHRKILEMLRAERGFSLDQAHDWFHDLPLVKWQQLKAQAEQALAGSRTHTTQREGSVVTGLTQPLRG
jgi:hypothetical protein